MTWIQFFKAKIHHSPLYLGRRMRFRLLRICKFHYRFPSLPPLFSLQKPSINLAWAFAAASEMEPSRGRLVRGKSSCKHKEGYCHWPIRFIHSKVMSFSIRVWKSWTEKLAVLSQGVERNEKRYLQRIHYLHSFRAFLCTFECRNVHIVSIS